MPRGDQLLRQWKLLQLLQTRGEGMPLARLAAEFEVSERTVQRDFELLQEMGFPLTHDADEYGKRYWRLPRSLMDKTPLVLRMTEAVSLHLAERLFAPLSGTHLAEGLDSLLAKIRSLLPAGVLDYFKELDHAVLVRPFASTDWGPLREVLATLDRAMQEGRSVEVDYHSLWRSASYTTRFDPYGLVLHLDDLFVVGYSHHADAVRVFKISRIRRATLSEASFDRPEDFNLEAFFRGSFGVVHGRGEPTEIVVQFSGLAAAVVRERIWHDSQRLAWLPAEPDLFGRPAGEDEGLVATFQLSEVVEFKRWLKGFGDQAVVLRPDWLRAELHQELLAAAAAYDPMPPAV